MNRPCFRKLISCFRKTKTPHDAPTVLEVPGDSVSSNTAKKEEEISMKCLLGFIECLNKHQSPEPLFHEHGEVLFKEAPMTIGGFSDELGRLFSSFPDFAIVFDDIMVHSPRCISVRFVAVGTHTGSPYGFGPFPEIQPKGAKVKLDAEYVPFQKALAPQPNMIRYLTQTGDAL